MVRSQLKPKLILYRAVDLLIREKTTVPSVSRLTELILRSLNNHKKQLIAVVEAHSISRQPPIAGRPSGQNV